MDDMLEMGDGMIPDIPRESIIKMRDEYSKSFHERSGQQVKRPQQIEESKQADPDGANHKEQTNEEEEYPALEIISGRS